MCNVEVAFQMLDSCGWRDRFQNKVKPLERPCDLQLDLQLEVWCLSQDASGRRNRAFFFINLLS